METDRKWIVKVGDKEHVIETDYGMHLVDPDTDTVLAHRDGTLLVDGTVMKTWDSELPKEISFEIGGKPAVLRKSGLFVKGLELSIEKVKIKPVS
jgi:hypothetical protein